MKGHGNLAPHTLPPLGHIGRIIIWFCIAANLRSILKSFASTCLDEPLTCSLHAGPTVILSVDFVKELAGEARMAASAVSVGVQACVAGDISLSLGSVPAVYSLFATRCAIFGC